MLLVRNKICMCISSPFLHILIFTAEKRILALSLLRVLASCIFASRSKAVLFGCTNWNVYCCEMESLKQASSWKGINILKCNKYYQRAFKNVCNHLHFTRGALECPLPFSLISPPAFASRRSQNSF